VADILVLPSRYETFGMVVAEGLPHGLPVIAAPGGSANILEHGGQDCVSRRAM
jgi:glycosyltransferase involved in cell wall biosynthesis